MLIVYRAVLFKSGPNTPKYMYKYEDTRQPAMLAKVITPANVPS